MQRNPADVDQSLIDVSVVSGSNDKQNISFLDNRDIFSVLLRQGKISELARIRQTCRIANRQFNQLVFANSAGVLLAVGPLSDNQLRKFLISNAAHIESLAPYVGRYDAAYASYALLGGVTLLDTERLPTVLTFLREQRVSPLIIYCVELVHAIYCPPIKFHDNFFDLLQRMAKDYLDDRKLGTLRPLFLDLLFRVTRSLENNESLLLEHRYQLVFHFLPVARNHEFFSVHRNTGLLPGRLFAVQRGGNTHSQDVIAAEIERVTNRHNHSNVLLTHTNLSI